MTNRPASYREVAPCEVCGQRARNDKQDAYRQASAHSKARALGYRYERTCAYCWRVATTTASGGQE